MGSRNFVILFVLALLALGAPMSAKAQQQPTIVRLYVAEIADGADKVDAALKESLRARIEEGLAATGSFAIETRLAGEASAIANEAAYVSRVKARGVDLIIFPVVDSLSCYRDVRPITAMPGKYNQISNCDAIMRVRIVSTKTDELRRSFELDESESKRLGVVDQREIDQLTDQPEATPWESLNELQKSSRFAVRLTTQSREFIELSRKLAASLTARVYDAAYPAEIIEVVGEEAYISRGSRGGLAIGAVLSVNVKGKELRHPVTGVVLGSADSRVATLRITEVFDDYAKGLLEDVTGTVTKGAVVRVEGGKPQ